MTVTVTVSDSDSDSGSGSDSDSGSGSGSGFSGDEIRREGVGEKGQEMSSGLCGGLLQHQWIMSSIAAALPQHCRSIAAALPH